MAPKGRPSRKERAVSLQERGAALSQKADLLMVTEALRHYPEYVVDLKMRFTDLGIIMQNGEVRVPESRRHSTKSCDDIAPIANDDDGLDEYGLPKGEPNIHRNYKRWDQCPPRTLRLLLNAVEPVAFNKFSMKAFQPKGCKEVQRLAMLALMGYVLEIDQSSCVSHGGDVRAIAENWARRNDALGHRGRDLRLPVSWSTCGFYQVTIHKGRAWVEEKFSGEEVVIEEFDGCVDLVGDVEHNHSKMMAVVTIKGSVDVIRISNVFLRHGKSNIFTEPANCSWTKGPPLPLENVSELANSADALVVNVASCALGGSGKKRRKTDRSSSCGENRQRIHAAAAKCSSGDSGASAASAHDEVEKSPTEVCAAILATSRANAIDRRSVSGINALLVGGKLTESLSLAVITFVAFVLIEVSPCIVCGSLAFAALCLGAIAAWL